MWFLKGLVNRLTCMIWSVFWTMNICHNKPLSISSPSLGMVISVQITHYIPANYTSQYDIAKYDRATREYYISSNRLWNTWTKVTNFRPRCITNDIYQEWTIQVKIDLYLIKKLTDHLNFENVAFIFLQVQLKNQKFNKLVQSHLLLTQTRIQKHKSSSI